MIGYQQICIEQHFHIVHYGITRTRTQGQQTKIIITKILMTQRNCGDATAKVC
jgi:hypothetical protein